MKLEFKSTGKQPTQAEQLEARKRAHLRANYECACIRAAAGPDFDQKRDWRELVKMHEFRCGKPLDDWNCEELERYTRDAKRKW